MRSGRHSYTSPANCEKIPGDALFMLGHSMGSSLLRQYIQMYGNGLSGVVLMVWLQFTEDLPCCL